MKLNIRILICIVCFSSFVSSISVQRQFSGTWIGEMINEMGYQWNLKLHIDDQNDLTQSTVKISFPDWGMFRLPTSDLNISNNEIEFKVLWLNAHFNGKLEGGVMKITWNEWGDASGSAHRVSKESNLFRRENIVLETDDGEVLKGTIVFPNSAPPYNGMVLTHGSGPDTRETGAYISKAHLAVENGLAVLIYDKRGAGESSGPPWANLSRLTEDALGMVEKLRSHRDIRQEKVGIGGSSQGAWIAPKVAYLDPSIAFVFTVATPGISPAEQNVYSLETRIESKKDQYFAKKALRTLYEYYRTNDTIVRDQAIRMINDSSHNLKNNKTFRNFTFTNGETPQDADLEFWSKAMFDDPLIWWREIKVPVASFSGEDDNNVPSILSNLLIKASLESADNSNFELHIFPNAGHGLSLNNLDDNDWKRLAHGYVSIMGSWFEKMSKK